MNKFKTRLMAGLLTAGLCLTAFSTTAFAGGPDYVEPTEEPVPEETAEPGEPLSEDSDISTRDLLYDKATNKQFITITDRDGNVFYLVIDYDSPVSEDEEQYKTYFLNPVDTDDLKALAEEAENKPAACTCTAKCAAGSIDRVRRESAGASGHRGAKGTRGRGAGGTGTARQHEPGGACGTSACPCRWRRVCLHQTY